MPAGERRWRTVVAFALALTAGTLAVAIAHRGISRFSSDSFHYLLLGDALAEGRGFVSGGSQHPDLTRPPLLPLLMAPLTWLLGDPVPAGIAIVSLAAAALAIPLFFLCRDLFGPRAGFAALPLSTVSCVLGSADRVLPTSLHLLGFVSTAALLVRALRRGTPSAYAWVGLSGALTALARPEGLPFLLLPVLWAVAGPAPFPEAAAVRPSIPARLKGVAWLVLGAALLLVPYVAWTSARLHRFAPLPSLEYGNDTRYVADRFGLREMAGPFVPWEERALFLLTADHEDRVLDLYFRTRAVPPADLAEARPERATAGPQNPAKPRDLVARRVKIALYNLRRIPHRLGAAHLLPTVPLLLGLVGVISWLARPGGWRPLALASVLLAFALLPLVTNLEDRFLYAPFAAGLVVAAAGWGEIDRRAASRLPAVARIALHAALLWGVAASGLTHRMGESPKLDLDRAQRALAARAGPSVPPGPVLAVRPHFPYWMGRPYAPLPIVGPQEVLAYARLHGARALAFEVPFDVKARPELAGLAAGAAPPGFVQVDAEPIGYRGEMLLFRLDPPAVAGLSGTSAVGRTP